MIQLTTSFKQKIYWKDIENSISWIKTFGIFETKQW